MPLDGASGGAACVGSDEGAEEVLPAAPLWHECLAEDSGGEGVLRSCSPSSSGDGPLEVHACGTEALGADQG
eukprot:9296457-Alexandrium_andersonii.AAC.1